MAAVNVGIILAKQSMKSLIVDWNFNSPKLAAYMRELCKSPSVDLASLLSEYKNLIDSDLPINANRLNQCGTNANLTSVANLFCLPVSVDSDLTFGKIAFNWVDFYDSYHGGLLIEHLRKQWETLYDAILIISERDTSDASAICTIQIPDVVVILTDMNLNGLKYSQQIINRILSPDKKTDGRSLSFLPVFSKFENAELQLRYEATRLAQEYFSAYLPPQIDTSSYFHRAYIPYISNYSFGHKTPVLCEDANDPLSLSASYMNLAQDIIALAKIYTATVK